MSRFYQQLTYYGLSHLGKSLLWSFFNTFFLFYAIYELGVTPLQAGVLLFIFSVSDAVFDIPVSVLMYRFQHKVPMAFWVKLATPICSVLLVLMFMKFFIQPTSPEFLKWAVMGLLFKLSFTFVDIPLNASIGRFEYDSTKRNYIAASRSIASTLSKLVIAFLIAVFVEQDKIISTDRLWTVALIIAVLCPIFIIPTFSFIDKSAQKLDVGYKFHSGEVKLKQAFKSIPTNLKLLIGANFFVLTLVAQFTNGLIFLINSNPKIDVSFTTVWQLMAIVSAFSVVLWMMFAGVIKKNVIAVINLCLLAILLYCHSVFFNHDVGILIFVGLYASLYHINSLIWSMLPDSVDEVSQQHDANMQVPTVGFFVALGKTMIGLGMLLSGIVLEYSGFPNAPNMPLYTQLIVYLSFFGCVGACFLIAFYQHKGAR